MPVSLTITVSPKGGSPFYTKSVTAKDWDHVENVQDAVVAALKNLGDEKRKHKAKGVDPSTLPQEAIVVTLETPDPDTGNVARFKIVSDPNLGRKTVTDSLDKQLKKF